MNDLNLEAYFSNAKHLRVQFHVAVQMLGTLLSLTTTHEWDCLNVEIAKYEYKISSR